MPAKRAGSGRTPPQRSSLPKQGAPTKGAPPHDVRAQADGAPKADDTGMGAFGDGEFKGGADGTRGYGQDTKLPGGLGQGSGYAQSSGMGGYGQGAPAQADGDQSGAAQHSDERYSRFDGSGEQRSSQYGYGGRGTEQQDGQQARTSESMAATPPDDVPDAPRPTPRARSKRKQGD